MPAERVFQTEHGWFVCCGYKATLHASGFAGYPCLPQLVLFSMVLRDKVTSERILRVNWETLLLRHNPPPPHTQHPNR